MHHNDPSEHRRPGCMKGIFYHLHNRRKKFAKKKLLRGRSPDRKWIADEDDGSGTTSRENGENRESCDIRGDKSVVETESEEGSTRKRSVRSRLKSRISEEVSKRKFRHKRSSSCPPQSRINRDKPINQNSSVHPLDPLDKSDVLMDEDSSAGSSPKVQEGMQTTPRTRDHCPATGTMNYSRQSEVDCKGKRPVKDHTFLEHDLTYAIDRRRASDAIGHRRAATLEESRLFLDALDLLNMRKELFLDVLHDPKLSLAHHLDEKRSLKSRGTLTKSLSLPNRGVLEGKDVSCKHEGHALTQGGTTSLHRTNSARKLSGESIPSVLRSEEATPELPPGQPKPTGAPVSPHHLNTGKEKVVIKRFKNLGERIRHAIKESRKERQHIFKDAVLHKVPHGKKLKGFKGQGDTSEKPPKTYMKNNLDQKSFKRATSFHDSVEMYNRLLDSDAKRDAEGKEPETLKLRTNATPSPIQSIPKRLNRIYSSPDLAFFHGLQMEEALDSTGWEPSVTSIFVDPMFSEGIVISGKHSESSPSKHLGSSSKRQSQENFEDVGEILDKIPKCESQENIIDAGVCLDKIPICEGQGNIVDVGVSLDRISRCESPSNIEDVDEGLDKMSICEDKSNSSYQEDVTDPAKYNLQDDRLMSHHLSLDGEDRGHELSTDDIDIHEFERGFSATRFHVKVKKSRRAEFDYVKGVLDLAGFSRNESLGSWYSPGQPVDPEILDEVRGVLVVHPELSEIEGRSYDYILLFDIVNEVLLEIYNKSSSYWPKPLSLRACIHPMPMGCHVVKEVWADIDYYLRWKPTTDHAYIEDGDAVAQDLSKYDGWMNLQFDSECVGLELEDLFFDDLLDEILSDLIN